MTELNKQINHSLAHLLLDGSTLKQALEKTAVKLEIDLSMSEFAKGLSSHPKDEVALQLLSGQLDALSTLIENDLSESTLKLK